MLNVSSLNLNPINNPSKKGCVVENTTLIFGPFSRYKIVAIHTRFDRVSWFVYDADLTDDLTGGPSVIRQEDTFEKAVNGLCCRVESAIKG
jgi:hypothetical protein